MSEATQRGEGKKLLALDPGAKETAWLVYDLATHKPIKQSFAPNETVLWRIENGTDFGELVIEGMASYGMAVGADVFTTCIWIGRFIQAFSGPHTLLYRPDIKLHLCQSRRAKDPNVRQALLDRFGGSREAAIGTKKAQGPLYEISGHLWSALAVAVTRADQIDAVSALAPAAGEGK